MTLTHIERRRRVPKEVEAEAALEDAVFEAVEQLREVLIQQVATVQGVKGSKSRRRLEVLQQIGSWQSVCFWSFDEALLYLFLYFVVDNEHAEIDVSESAPVVVRLARCAYSICRRLGLYNSLPFEVLDRISRHSLRAHAAVKE